jgi:cytochrome c551/c552
MKSLYTALALMAVSFLLLISAVIYAENGLSTFNKKGCKMCHSISNDANKMGPSVTQIRKAYKGNLKGLIGYLKGKGKPKLLPDKYSIMKTQLKKLENLSGNKLRELAEFLAYSK